MFGGRVGPDLWAELQVDTGWVDLEYFLMKYRKHTAFCFITQTDEQLLVWAVLLR